jgi:hypothetical protein
MTAIAPAAPRIRSLLLIRSPNLRCDPRSNENLRDAIPESVMNDAAPASSPIRHNESAQRFETFIDGKLSRADYRLHDGVMHMVHTEVPIDQEGQGIAATLVRAALEYARAQGYKVRPACSYVRAFMARNREFDDLRA